MRYGKLEFRIEEIEQSGNGNALLHVRRYEIVENQTRRGAYILQAVARSDPKPYFTLDILGRDEDVERVYMLSPASAEIAFCRATVNAFGNHRRIVRVIYFDCVNGTKLNTVESGNGLKIVSVDQCQIFVPKRGKKLVKEYIVNDLGPSRRDVMSLGKRKRTRKPKS